MKWNKEKIIFELKELEKKLGRIPKKRDNSYLYFLSRQYFSSWNRMMKYAGYSVKTTQKPIIPKIYSTSLYYFLGILITDGHIAIKPNRIYQIKLYTSFSDEKEILIKLIKFLFKYNPSLRSRKTEFSENLNYEIYLSSKELCYFLTEKLGIPQGNKSSNVVVPKFIINSNDLKKGSFLRGVIDGDGSILKGNVIKISSGSREFLTDIKNILFGLRVKSGKICCEKNNVYNLWICGSENVIKLKKLIYKDKSDFYYPRKKLSWEQYI